MALIQINQKLLHITIALLLYGVYAECFKCPEVCHCVQTSVRYDGNASRSDLGDGVRSPQGPDATPRVTETPQGPAAAVGLDGTENAAANVSEIASRDMMHNSTTGSGPGEVSAIKNAKQNRTKRSWKPGEGSAAASRQESLGSSRRGTKSSDADEKSGYFTYQITCDEVRDPKVLSLRDLPNPTTQLVVRRASFRSAAALFRLVRDSAAELSLLSDLSVTDSEVDVAVDGNGTAVDDLRQGRRKFVPFASLQNPRPRDDVAGPDLSRLLLILNLSNNSLRRVPKDAFAPYPNLQTLDLSQNLIQVLDDEVFGGLTDLLRLDLRNNRIMRLNELVFKNLTKLLTLDLSKNSVSNIAPSTFQYLTSLNTLILSGNPLSMKQQSTILLGTGKRLQIVDASETGLKQVPGTLERSVQTLNLRGNRLSSIQCGDLDSYSLLTYLDLGNNKISYVEDDALGRLELLTDLRINDNSLFQIPKSLPNNLEILNLSYNNIRNISNSDFLNLSMLKELYVSYNQVSNIEENSFDNLGELRVLDLSHNPILILPNMYGLVKLATLNLSYFTNIPDRYKYEEFPAQAPENIRVLNLESSPVLTRTFLRDTETLQAFVNLEELHLRFSNLTGLRKDIFSLLPKLRVLEVEGNPWHCERDILELSEWLEAHESAEAPPEEEGDEVNTAHCATPPVLRKKPLVALTREDFAEGGNFSTRETEKLGADFALERRTAPKKIQKIQSKDEIHFKSFQKPVGSGGDGEAEDLSNASRESEIDLTARSNSSRKEEVGVSPLESAAAVAENGTECCSNGNGQGTVFATEESSER